MDDRRQTTDAAAAATATGSNEPWIKLDRTVTDSAVVMPFLNLKATDFVSKRVGNYQHHPTFDLLTSQLWVQ